MFFLLKFLLMTAITTACVRAGMHAQELLDEGRSLLTVPGLEAVAARLQADVDTLLQIFQ